MPVRAPALGLGLGLGRGSGCNTSDRRLGCANLRECQDRLDAAQLRADVRARVRDEQLRLGLGFVRRLREGDSVSTSCNHAARRRSMPGDPCASSLLQTATVMQDPNPDPGSNPNAYTNSQVLGGADGSGGLPADSGGRGTPRGPEDGS